MKNLILLIAVFTLGTYSCKESQKSKIEDILFNFSKTERPKRINSKKSKEEYDLKSFDSAWLSLTNDPWPLIDYLFTFKNDTNFYVYINNAEIQNYFGYLELRTSYYLHPGYNLIPNNVAALYLINAIYYDNYYFASNKIICDSKKVFFDSTCGLFVQHPCINSVHNISAKSNYKLNTQTDRNTLNFAWELANDWRSHYHGTSLNELRKMKKRPFGLSSLFWIGEIGDKVNKKFPQKLCKFYSR